MGITGVACYKYRSPGLGWSLGNCMLHSSLVNSDLVNNRLGGEGVALAGHTLRNTAMNFIGATEAHRGAHGQGLTMSQDSNPGLLLPVSSSLLENGS